jgi:hypothetical protein
VTSTAYVGRGSKLYSSPDGITYTAIAQLKSFKPAGSKQNMVDQTNLRTPDNFTRPLAAQVDSGEIEIAGVYSADATQFNLGQLHGQMTLAYFKATLTDGSIWLAQAYVSEWVPWEVVYNKFIPFSGKLRIAGGITPPSGPQI